MLQADIERYMFLKEEREELAKHEMIGEVEAKFVDWMNCARRKG